MSGIIRTPEEVAACAIPVDEEKTPAVYFLLREGRIVYVGQTVDIRYRIETHRREAQKKFDAYAYYPTPVDDLLQAEVANILAHDPEYNRCLPANPWYISRLQIPRMFRRLPYHGVRRAMKAGKLQSIKAVGREFFAVRDLTKLFGRAA